MQGAGSGGRGRSRTRISRTVLLQQNLMTLFAELLLPRCKHDDQWPVSTPSQTHSCQFMSIAASLPCARPTAAASHSLCNCSGSSSPTEMAARAVVRA